MLSPHNSSPGQDFLINLAASLAYDLMKLVGSRLRDAAFGDSERQAFRRAYEYAFRTMLLQEASSLDTDARQLLDSILRDFINDVEVSDLLLDLALSEQEPPLADLRARFGHLGFDPTTLPFDFDAALSILVSALAEELRQEAAQHGSPLYNKVNLAKLITLRNLLEDQHHNWQEALQILRRLEQEPRVTVVDIADGSQVIVEMARTKAEEAEQAHEFERKRLAEALIVRIGRLLRRAEEAQEQPEHGSPYKALLEYDISDTPLFYGRSEAIGQLLGCLERGPLTVLHAESGAGKTSLLKAGILPRLLAHGDTPLYVRPYDVPVHVAIKRALLPQLENTPYLAQASLHDFLRHVTDLLGEGRLVVLIDQFEELFTMQDVEAWAEFVAELAPCLDDTSLSVCWVLAVRDEWFGQLGTFQPHIRHPFANEYLLHAFSRNEALEIITEPARQLGVTYESGLVETLIDDLGEDKIAPPQLQLVCSTLFDALVGGTQITHRMYDELGRASGILRGHLERVLRREVPPNQRQVAQRLLEALITSEKRRVLRTADDLATELQVLDISQAGVNEVLSILVDSRLLRVEEVGDGETTLAYELAHDYLLDEIELDPTTQARKAAQELLAQKLPYYVHDGLLLSADELAIIDPQRQWLSFSEEAESLLQESRAAVTRQRRLTLAGIIVALTLIIGAVIAAIVIHSMGVREQANIHSTSSTEQASIRSTATAAQVIMQSTALAEQADTDHALAISKSLALAAQAEVELQGPLPERAVLLGLEALENYPYTWQAERALGQAVQATRLRQVLTGHTDWVWGAEYSPDDKYILSASSDRTARIWSADTGEVLQILTHPCVIWHAAYSPDGSRFVTASDDLTAKVWDAETGEELLTLEGHTSSVSAIAYNSDGTRIVTASTDHTAIVWDAETGEKLLTRELGEDRRCVVFVAQTGTLDIQPRLEALIKQHVPGAKPFIMQASSPATDQRDAYLEKQVTAGYNVLIVNPRLVQTGLDLIDFPTLIFAETDYSLYVTSQAARRAWRIGQAHPCRTYYLYYSGTMEAQAIALISRKQAAAALLGGDADGGGLAQLSGGSNSLLAELAKTIAEDEQVVDATQLFRQKAEESLDFTSGWAASIAEKAKQAPQPADIPSPASKSEAKEPVTTIIPPDKSGDKEQPIMMVSALDRYQAIKRQFPHALVLLEMGGFYEAFNEDAKTLADVLNIILTSRKLGDKRLPMAGIPRQKAEAYIARLIEAGHHVALATANGSTPASQTLKPERTLTARVPKPEMLLVTTGQASNGNGKPKSEKPASKDPHTDLYGQTFIDPEDRELTVTGPDPLFPDTHVQIQREGKAYSILAEKVRRFTPVKPNGHCPRPETACHAPQPALL